MLENVSGARAQTYANTVLVQKYVNAQRQRWMTENRSEGRQWDRLNDDYAKRKRKQFSAYPGRGTKMLIATNNLFESVTEKFQKVVTRKSLIIRISGPEYAPYVDEKRNFTRWGNKTISNMRQGWLKYVRGSK